MNSTGQSPKKRIDVGIDIGISKVCVAVGERKSDGTLQILGVGQAPSRGVRMGEIVDFGMAVECVREALTDAEEASDVVVGSARLAITGSQIIGIDHRATIDILDFQAGIDEDDCQSVKDAACNAIIPEQNVFLHRLLQHYRIDGQRGIRNPLGLHGSRLEGAFHIIHGMSERIKTPIRCIRELSIEVDDIVFSPLAASRAVLTQDQKDEGVLLLDIGAGTTDYILYIDGQVHQSGALSVGGAFVSHDISYHCNIPFATAESLKIVYGSALIGTHPPDERIPPGHSPALEGKMIGREELNPIVHMRMRETLELLKRRLVSGADPVSRDGGLVIIGGTSQLKGIGQLAEEIFDMPVHLAHEPTAASLDAVFRNPQFSTALGLLCIV